MSKEEIKEQSVVAVEKDYSWKEEQELILKKWADKAVCFKMMHERANKKYWGLNAWFNIPVIIISTITGTGNFATYSLGSNAPLFTFIIGAFNIFAGILATIATYTGVAQKLEAHRFASISWDKFSRKIQIELSKARDDRVKAKDFIKQCGEDFDRLIEISPLIPNDIIRWFTKMVATGEFETNINEFAQFCFDCICFPCGCSICSCITCPCICSTCPCICSSENNNEEIRNQLKASWAEVELPDVIGRIQPTKIARPIIIIPETPPPLVMVDIKREDNRVENKNNKNKEKTNIYDIYNLNSIDDNIV